jgi:hypothetical protein
VNRDELLALGERVWADLVQAAAEVPTDRREQQGVVEGWSVHDVVWHVSYWLERSAGVLEQVRPGARLARRAMPGVLVTVTVDGV